MKFLYEAMDATGLESAGSLEAEDLNQAAASMRQMGLFATKISPMPEASPSALRLPRIPWATMWSWLVRVCAIAFVLENLYFLLS